MMKLGTNMRLLSRLYTRSRALRTSSFAGNLQTVSSVRNVLPIKPFLSSCRQYSTPPPVHPLQHEVGPSRLESKSHSMGEKRVQALVEPYFADHWEFSSEKERKGFHAVGLSRAFCQLFPLTLNERVEATCKLHYLLVLVDDKLDQLDVADLLSCRERIMQVAQMKIDTDRSNPMEWMLSDIIKLMRGLDEPLTDDVIERFCALLEAQTAPERTSVKHLGPYLQRREIDMGRDFYPALIRFGANLHLSDSEIHKSSQIESIAFRQMGVLNDVYSWEKEWKTYQSNLTVGSQPFSAVYVLAQETGLPYSACKRLLLRYCRELETVFEESVEDIRRGSNGTPRPEFETYIKGLELFTSGLEEWTKWSPRYR